ncbi:hypothetical protein BD769DRAFT_1455159 [Suillus cothurnatus]|nr:hypothetical protein BD769DRAFT_1455159 [Suillus cothurnatus]
MIRNQKKAESIPFVSFLYTFLLQIQMCALWRFSSAHYYYHSIDIICILSISLALCCHLLLCYNL